MTILPSGKRVYHSVDEAMLVLFPNLNREEREMILYSGGLLSHARSVDEIATEVVSALDAPRGEVLPDS